MAASTKLIKTVCVQGSGCSGCSGGEEERDEGSVLQRPMRFVHAAFSSGLETLVEQPTYCYHDCCAPFNLLCVMVVHVRNVCELDGIGRCG